MATTSKKPPLGKLLKNATDISEPDTAKTKAKLTVALEGEEAELLDGYAGRVAVLEVAAAGQNDRKEQLKLLMAAHYLRICAESGFKAPNPDFSTQASKAGFQVKLVAAVHEVKGADGKTLTIEDQFRAAGFDEETVAEIVAKVVKRNTTLRVKSLTELAVSEDEAQKSIAEKLTKYIEKFTSANQKLMLGKFTQTTIDESWKDVAVALACKLGGDDQAKRAEVLAKLWSVLPVQYVMANVVYSGEVGEAFAELLETKEKSP
jgi:hypothetical protein